ncbi:peptide chain release factor 3 [Humibacillus xanthopallidus]|uniref:Peptide chain release factor 3 n=1 Tax=Humibacillus xanthopallidus TaxID=412689 RepID=A0A543HWX6_9MICO|nr:peptide chain release factor 3 [Humibacillus xanthopallidus]TQM62858.1 peptide chain release factor 3 (bRF-3) [Humibacillus xanthopallidus]
MHTTASPTERDLDTTRHPTTGGTASPEVAEQAARRRTFAVISHPDAGKSTLTEALALHAHAIGEAGAVHGKGNRRGVVSDWMEMERDRGISITSAVLQFAYAETVVNLLDTPGHADFSEDTYRVLAAVDAAVMLVDAAKGIEPQTHKLFEVCRARGVPVITVVNKWDRPGLDALAIMDELTTRLDLHPMPLTWPVGVAGDFRGVLDCATGDFVEFTRTPGGATEAIATRWSADEARRTVGDAFTQAEEEYDLLNASGHGFDLELFLSGAATPVLFGSAVLNFGVRQLLDTLVALAPAPSARADVSGGAREVSAPFSGFVFKIQAGMDKAHRDRLAFVRVCSGRFTRGMVVTHADTGRPFATKYAQSVFGRERATLDEAFPGDVIGLVNANALRVGDTLFAEEKVAFPRIPLFAPEHFAVARAAVSGKQKQFRRGIEQLGEEGVVQVLHSDRRGAQAPVLAAVGPMQFDVAKHRMEHEFGSPIRLEPLPYSVARAVTPDALPQLENRGGAEALTRADGVHLAVFADKWRMSSVERDLPAGALSPIFG